MPDQSGLIDVAYKSFIPKFIITVLFFMEVYPEYVNEFTPIVQKYNQFLNNNKNDSNKVQFLLIIFAVSLKENPFLNSVVCNI